MKLLARDHQTIHSRRDSDGEIVETVERWTLTFDNRQIFNFDHDPTDDEVFALISKPIRVRPTSLADRVEAAAELAAVWNALRLAAAEAATDAAFTAAERTRLNGARDLARAALKAYV